MLDAIIRGALSNRLLVLSAAVLLLALGLYNAHRAPVDVFPNFAPPEVFIQTEAPGFAPHDVEQQVTFPLENALLGLSGVQDVRSTSIAGASAVTVIFQDNTNIWRDRQLVSEALSAARNLPAGIRPRMVPVTSAIGLIMDIGMTEAHPKTPYQLRTLADWLVRRRLLAVPGVAGVTVYGGEVKQYQVRVSPARLASYGLTLSDVLRATAEVSTLSSGGFYHGPGQDLVIHANGLATSVDQLRQSVVAVRQGVPLTLGEVADVRLGQAPPIGGASINGGPGVVLQVFKQPWADTVPLTQAVQAALQGLRPGLPRGLRIYPDLFSQASFINSSQHELRLAMLEGGLLVVFVLLLFLRSGRAAAISLIAIPLSLAVAVFILVEFGASINTMTLGGLVLALGEVVDDAIIDVENILRRLRQQVASAGRVVTGVPLRTLVYEASREVRGSVVFATLIVMVVFGPVFFLHGVEGRIFRPLAEVYVLSTAASLLVALTVTPVLAYWWLPRVAETSGENRLVAALHARYRGLLARTMPHPRAAAVVSLSAAALALVAVPFLGGSFLPAFNEGNAIVHMTSLPGTSLRENLQVGERLEKAVLRIPGVVSMDQRAGRAALGEDVVGLNSSEFDVRFRAGASRSATLNRIRRLKKRFPAFQWDIEQFISERMSEVLSGSRADVAVQVYGPSLDQLQRIAATISNELNHTPGALDVSLQRQTQVPELQVDLNRAAAAAYGLRSGDVTNFVRTAFFGAQVGEIYEGERRFALVVRLPRGAKENLAAISSAMINTPAGPPIPLSDVANISIAPAPDTITRENGSRMMTVSCNVSGGNLTGFVHRVQYEINRDVHLPPGYYLRYAGAYESRTAAGRLLLGLGAAALALVIVLLLLAFQRQHTPPSEAVRAASLVLFTLPMAFVGGVAAVLISRGNISVATLIGFITLLGITARNGIMLVSHYRHLEDSEGEAFGASLVLRGAEERLLPILMTACATGLALLPILLGGQQPGRELEFPMALVIAGGLLTSTALNLLVMPTLYLRFAKAPAQLVRQ